MAQLFAATIVPVEHLSDVELSCCPSLLTTSGLQILPARHRVVEGRPEVLEVEPEDHEQGDLEGGCNDRLEADWAFLCPLT